MEVYLERIDKDRIGGNMRGEKRIFSINKWMMMLLFSKALFATADATLKVQEGIDKLKKIESEIVYDRIIEKNPPTMTHVNGGEKVFVTFDGGTINDTTYFVFSNHQNPNSVKVINNAFLQSPAEVIGSRHSPFEHLIYIENNGTMRGYADNVPGISLSVPTAYVKNSEQGKLIGTEHNIFHIRGLTDFVLENDGLIMTERPNETIYVSAKNAYARNGKNGRIEDSYEHYSGKQSYFSNEGFLNGITLGSNVVGLKNSGAIQNYLSINGRFNLDFHNTEEGKIQVESMSLDGGNLQFENDGLIQKTGTTDPIQIKASEGNFINRKQIIGNLSFLEGRDRGHLAIALEGGKLEGDILLNRGIGTTTELSLDSESNVSGRIEGNGPDETLKLLGRGKVDDGSRYEGFEKLYLKNSRWELAETDFHLLDSSRLENSTLILNGGNLISPETTIDAQSSLAVHKNHTITGDVHNLGKIYFDSSALGSYNSLYITGNYTAQDAKIQMRVKVEGNPILNDSLIIGGDASGSTFIELSNPNSSLEKRMIGRAKLVETASSLAGTFRLARDKYGRYRYRLFSEVEGQKTNWYIDQTEEEEELPKTPDTTVKPEEKKEEPEKSIPNMPKEREIAQKTFDRNSINVASSYALAQNMFLLHFHDRTGGNIELDKKTWARVTKHSVQDYLVNSSKDSSIRSHYHTVQFGYDIDKGEYGSKKWVYGLLGDYAYGKTKISMEKQEDMNHKVEGYGLGLYASVQGKHWYIDHWSTWNRYRNTLYAIEDGDYHFKGFQSSLELGYRNTFTVKGLQMQVEPQGQMIYSNFTKPDLKKFNEYDYRGRENMTARLGMRLTALSLNKQFDPFVEMNYWNSRRRIGVAYGGEEFLLAGNKDVKEVKLGFRSSLFGEQVSLWLYASQRYGQKSYRDKYLQLGMNYRF